jgi:hypothetical protein
MKCEEHRVDLFLGIAKTNLELVGKSFQNNTATALHCGHLDEACADEETTKDLTLLFRPRSIKDDLGSGLILRQGFGDGPQCQTVETEIPIEQAHLTNRATARLTCPTLMANRFASSSMSTASTADIPRTASRSGSITIRRNSVAVRGMGEGYVTEDGNRKAEANPIRRWRSANETLFTATAPTSACDHR